MTIIKLGCLINYDIIKKQIDNITLDKFNNLIQRNKKYYKFINLKFKNKHEAIKIFIYYVIMEVHDRGEIYKCRERKLPRCFNNSPLVLPIWNIIKMKNVNINNMPEILKDKYPLVVKDGENVTNKNMSANNNYFIRNNIKKGLMILSFQHWYYTMYRFYLNDDSINLFLLMNNLLGFLEIHYITNISIDVYDHVFLDIQYKDPNNYKNINIIDTCLPLSNFTKILLSNTDSYMLDNTRTVLDNDKFKLSYNTKQKIIKIIYMLNKYNIYINIINKII